MKMILSHLNISIYSLNFLKTYLEKLVRKGKKANMKSQMEKIQRLQIRMAKMQ